MTPLMLRTRLCDVLGIETPLVLAPFGPWDQVVLAAAVSNAGGLGVGGHGRPVGTEMRAQWAQLAQLTDRPFAINHTGRPFDEAAFAATLDSTPTAISFHMGVPAEHYRAGPDRRHPLAADRRRPRRRPSGRSRPAPTSSSPRVARRAATAAGWRRWCSCPRWSTSPATSRWWPPAGSPTAEASQQRWHSAPRARASAPGSWPRPR